MDVETGTAVPRSPVSVAVSLRGHTLLQDKPASAGGKDEGPMASELLLAAVLACQHSTFHKIAQKRRSDARLVRLSGAVHFDAAGDIARIEVKAEVEGDRAAAQTILRLAEKACTISKALRVPVESSLA